MSKATECINALNSGEFDGALARLYGTAAVPAQRKRYAGAVTEYVRLFGEDDDIALFSAPGRTEIGGNHTDHNHGLVLAGAVNLDVIAVAARTDAPAIHIHSAGYQPNVVKLDCLEPQADERNGSASLVRGVAARFRQRGYRIGGLRAYTTSNVLKGSGLSSSAAFEVLLGTMLNHLYNGGQVGAVEIACIAQYAENEFFGKPSGLMDQMACSVGGVVSIDFADTANPIIRTVDYDFSQSGHGLCIVDTGGDHAALTHEYADVTAEMRQIANALDVDFLRETSYEALLPRIAELRAQFGDRAVLRALHFWSENERVEREVAALENGDFATFLALVNESGHSSFEYLQNVYSSCAPQCQGLSLALALAGRVLNGEGACRVHGGGFGGTTQNFVPLHCLNTFTSTLESVFGTGSCHVLNIRPCGGVQVVAE